MSLRIFDPSSGGDTRSWRASACSASSRYFVCSANSTRGRRSRKSPRRGACTRGRTPGRPARPTRSGELAVAGRAAHEREQSGGDHRPARPGSSDDSSGVELLGAAAPDVLSDLGSVEPPRDGPAGLERGARQSLGERRIAEQSPDAPPARCASPGSTSSALSSCLQDFAQRRQIRATIGRPAAMYSNSFSGDVNRVEIADAGFGSASTSRARSSAATSRGRDQSRERHARRQCRAAPPAPSPAPGPVPSRARRRSAPARPAARQRLEQDVDALPGIQVACVRRVGRRELPTAPFARRLVWSADPIRAPSGTTAIARAAPKRAVELGRQAAGDRDISVRGAATRAPRAAQPAQLARRRRRASATSSRQRRGHVRRKPVRLVDDRRPQAARQPQQQRRTAEVAREDHVRPRAPIARPTANAR